jgi:hypothetical protein
LTTTIIIISDGDYDADDDDQNFVGAIMRIMMTMM